MAIINLSQKDVVDSNNSFFKNNKILAADSVPATGSFTRGDIIINTNDTNSKHSMWVCTESGTPGSWTVLGPSGQLITVEDTITINEPVSEISLLGVGGIIEAFDKIDVYLNSTHLVKGLDYTINADGTKIVKTSGQWNETSEEAVFNLVLLKSVESIDPEDIVVTKNTKIVFASASVKFSEPKTEVDIPIKSYSPTTDSLLVFKNGLILNEGIEYQQSGSKIVCLNGEWNSSSLTNYEMTFVVLKEVVLYDESLLEMQLKTDPALNTEDKTVVGAINELKAQIDSLNEQVAILNNDLINMTQTVNSLNAQVASQAATIEEQRLQGIAAANSLLDEL